MFLLRDGLRFEAIKRTGPFQVQALLTFHQEHFPLHCWSVEVAS